MESQTYIKNIRISPKKLRFILPEIKKMSPVGSLDFLLYTRKDGAKIFYEAIKSAINNAKNTLKVSDDLLKFKLLTVEEGPRLKRFRPGGRGTAKVILKRFAHIKIVLEAKKVVSNKKNVVASKKEVAKVAVPTVKVEEKKVEKKTVKKVNTPKKAVKK